MAYLTENGKRVNKTKQKFGACPQKAPKKPYPGLEASDAETAGNAITVNHRLKAIGQ